MRYAPRAAIPAERERTVPVIGEVEIDRRRIALYRGKHHAGVFDSHALDHAFGRGTLNMQLALVLVVVIVWVFMWAVRSDQFDDLEGPAHRILMDEDEPKIDQAKEEQESSNKK